MRPQIYDIGVDTNKVRERAVAKTHISVLLFFTQPEDETLYANSLKNLFYFKTFWPVIIVYLVFSAVQTELLGTMGENDTFLTLTAIMSLLNIFLITLFTVAQLVDFMHSSIPVNSTVHIASMYILRRLFRGRVEDIVIILALLGQGFHQLSLITRNMCLGCGKIFEIVNCQQGDEKIFPVAHAFFGFISIILLPVYFKSINRHVTLLCWLMFTAFIIAAHLFGDYQFQGSIVLFVLFWFVSIYEAERYKMTSYLLSKEALSFEQNKLIIEQEKAKIIQRKLQLALVDQILPRKVAEQIIAGKTVEPESFEEVTVFFSDVVGFTNICAEVKPIQVVGMLNELYTVMDYCCQQFSLYKVETIGDAYMVVGGLPEKSSTHAQDVANFAILVSKAVQAVKSPLDGTPIRIRIGMHSGPVMAGVVGNLMPRYCLFGDTVNTASRMESNGEQGKVHCSEATAKILLSSGFYVLESRGNIPIKGKGSMHTYWLEGAVDENEECNNDAVAKIVIKARELIQSNRDQNNSRRLSLLALEDNFEVSPGVVPHLASGPHPDEVPKENTEDAVSLFVPAEDSKSFSLPNKSMSPTNLQQINKGSVIAKNLNRLSSSGPGVHNDAEFSSGAKILVVEDSATQRKVLVQRLHLADRSWDVSFAVSGEDALQKLKAAKFQFDVVLVDENLSINDGLYGHELVQVMRESYGMVGTIIIACTSNAEMSRENLLGSGVDEVWSKPPPAADQVKHKIEELLIMRINQLAIKSGLKAELKGASSKYFS